MFEIGDLVVRAQDWRKDVWAEHCAERKLNVGDVFKVKELHGPNLVLQQFEYFEWHSNKFERIKINYTIEEFL